MQKKLLYPLFCMSIYMFTVAILGPEGKKIMV